MSRSVGIDDSLITWTFHRKIGLRQVFCDRRHVRVEDDGEGGREALPCMRVDSSEGSKSTDDDAMDGAPAAESWQDQGEAVMDQIRSWAGILLQGSEDDVVFRRIQMESSLGWIKTALDFLRPGHFKLAGKRSRGVLRRFYRSVSLLRCCCRGCFALVKA